MDARQAEYGTRKKIVGTSAWQEVFPGDETNGQRTGVFVTVSGPGVAEFHDNDTGVSGDLPWYKFTDGQTDILGYFSGSKKLFFRGAGMTVQFEQLRAQTI